MTRGSSNICAYMRYMHASGQTKQLLCVLLAALAGRRGSHLFVLMFMFMLCYVCMHGSHLFMLCYVCMPIYAHKLELAVASQSLAEASRNLAEPRRSLAEPREASRSLAKPRRSRSECCEASRSSQSLAKASRKPRGASQNVQFSAFARNFEVVVPNPITKQRQ